MATPHLREREQSLRGWYKLLQVGCARVDPVRSSHTRAQRQLCSCTASNTRASTEHSTDKYFRGTVRNRPAAVRHDTQTHNFLLRPSSHATLRQPLRLFGSIHRWKSAALEVGTMPGGRGFSSSSNSRY